MYGYGYSPFVKNTVGTSGAVPVNTVTPVISGSLVVGSTLTCSTGTWTGTLPITYSYQWYSNYNPISGQTNNTYVTQNSDVGVFVYCSVTATNAFGSVTIGSSAVTPTWEADAQAFITAAAITNPTQQSAINQLVVDLKGYNVWSKFSALYPFIGGTASQHKFNLKNPLDTNAAFRLVFNGGGTHSINGYQTNGVNAFAETYYNPFNNLTDINSNHISIYSRTNNLGGIDMGGGPVPLVDLELNYAATSFNWNMASNFSHTNSNSTGFYINTRTASNAFKLIKNGSTVLGSSTGAAGATKPNNTYHIGKRNLDSLWTNRQYAFASIGDGLTDTEAANFYTAVQTFQTTLGRSIGTQTVSDPDAQAFVTAANIQDQVEANAVNNLVIGLKSDGLWSKMKAIYPFVGGTASTHKFNLKNPLDTDAAFRLVFNGGGTHSSTGWLPNGTNAFADTKLIPSTNFTTYNHHIAIYSRTNSQRDSWNGAYMNSGQAERFILRSTDAPSGAFYYWSYGWAASSIFTANTDSRGLFLVTNRSASDREAYRNGITLATNTFNMSAYSPVNISLFIGSNNVNGSPSTYDNKEIAFGSLGDGLTDTEAANFYTRVQAFNTALNRQV